MIPAAAPAAPIPEVAAYLARLPPDQQSALLALRAVILDALPDAVERISHAMPACRQKVGGKFVVGDPAFAIHCGLYPFSGRVIAKLTALCQGFKTSKSGVLFTPAQPLPRDLVLAVIRTRLAELETFYPPKPSRTPG